MTEPAGTLFVVSAETSDLYDALGRVLADGQRFGIRLLSVRAQAGESGISDLRLLVVADGDARDSLEKRLSRHPSIAGLVVASAHEASSA